MAPDPASTAIVRPYAVVITHTSRRRPPTCTECRKIGALSTVPGSETVWRRRFGAVAAVMPIDALDEDGRDGGRPKTGQSVALAAVFAFGAGAGAGAEDRADAVVSALPPLAPPQPAASALSSVNVAMRCLVMAKDATQAMAAGNRARRAPRPTRAAARPCAARTRRRRPSARARTSRGRPPSPQAPPAAGGRARRRSTTGPPSGGARGAT